MRLLLVEDDVMIGEAVLDLLRAENYAVDWVKDGDAADTALRAQQYDLVLLDLGVPRRDGLEVLRALRARKQRMPVLIATARDSVQQRIAGLDAGADDYVLKPYDLDELLARIRALLRRASGRAEPVYEHMGVSINPATREVTVGRPAGGAVGARMGGARAADRAARHGAVARAARRKALRLEGRDQQQRGRGLRPRAAQEARRGLHPQRARRRLHGAQGMKSPARARLLWFLLAAIVLAAGTQAFVAYRTVLDEAEEIFDYHMQQMALSLRAGPAAQRGGRRARRRRARLRVRGPGLDRRRRAHLRIGRAAALPQRAVLGFSNVQARGTTYRVFSMQTRARW